MHFEVMYTQYPWIKGNSFKHHRKVGLLLKSASWKTMPTKKLLFGLSKRGCLKDV